MAGWIGGAPGKIARERNHPQADAINVCGWLGLITLGVPWIIAMVWAYTTPLGRDLTARVTALEEEVRRLRGNRGGAPS